MKKDTRATYKPSKAAIEYIEVIKKNHPELKGVSAIINYALQQTAGNEWVSAPFKKEESNG